MTTTAPPPIEGEQRRAGTATRSDLEAFDRHVRPFVAPLRRFALSLTGNVDDAEDLLQEVLFLAFRAIGRFDGRYPRAWLYTIMRNAWHDDHRHRHPVPSGNLCEITVASFSYPMATPDEALDARSLDPAVERALAALPEHQRVIVESVLLRGNRGTEAAGDMAIPIGTVRSRLHRACVALRRELAQGERAVSRGGDC